MFWVFHSKLRPEAHAEDMQWAVRIGEFESKRMRRARVGHKPSKNSCECRIQVRAAIRDSVFKRE